MKKQLLSACLAAIAMAGCHEPTKPEPSRPAAVRREAKPVLEPAPVVAVVDAGTMVKPEQPPADLLGIAHEHRAGVDHLARAAELRSQGELDGALAEVRRAVFDDPTDEDALHLASRLARMTGQRELALEAFARLAEVRSDDPMPLVQQARLLLAMKDYEGAVKVGSEAIERDPQNPEGYQAVGRAHLNAGELASAIAMFQRAIEVNPDHGYALNNLGFAYLRANENEKAVEVLTRAAELLPSVAYVHNNLGVALERQGDLEGAKLAYANSTSLSPKYVKARVNSDRVAKVVTSDLDQAGDMGGEELPLPEVEIIEE